jgi:hypothetical protein
MQHQERDPRRFRIHRNKRGWPRWYQRWLEAWWIITGDWSLHKAWQDGLTYGIDMEYRRLITNRAYLAEISTQIETSHEGSTKGNSLP